MKTIEEMHKMTIDELQEYGNSLWAGYRDAEKIRRYRLLTMDEYNPTLLTIPDDYQAEEERESTPSDDGVVVNTGNKFNTEEE
jgi:hypothetical protein